MEICKLMVYLKTNSNENKPKSDGAENLIISGSLNGWVMDL